MFSSNTPSKKPVRFPRNRHRESEEQNFFKIANQSLSFMATIVIPAIFTPALIISSLVSHGILFSLGNIALALGYTIHFIRRLISHDISYPELFTSFAVLGALLAVTFASAPITFGWTIIQCINFLNLISTGINSFFLIREFLVPPLQAVIKYTFTSLGFEVQTSFFSTPPLKLKKDGPVIDRLLQKHYKHDSFSPEFSEQKIRPFNALLKKMDAYINKYQEPLFGTLLEQKNIKRLENAIDDVVNKGNTDSALGFINQKIDFKIHKIKRIQQAIDASKAEQEEEHIPTISQSRHGFFKQPKPVSYELSELQTELERQEAKVASLRLCLP